MVVADFHRLYYGSRERTWKNTFWLGHAAEKCPLDLWVYQELLTDLRPDLILETGTAAGGSALFLASVCDLLDRGSVVTVDVRDMPGRPEHPRIRYLKGSSTAEDVAEAARGLAAGAETVFVILDSDHSQAHVLDELRLYAPLVTPGSYVVVEDTNVNGHPVRPDFGPGPMEAVEDYLRESDAFEIDSGCEKYFMTFNPGGYLRRVR